MHRTATVADMRIEHLAGVGGSTPAHLQHDGCTSCIHRSRYGNCLQPEAAGLAPSFRIVAHPQEGIGCQAWEPVMAPEDTGAWRVVVG